MELDRHIESTNPSYPIEKAVRSSSSKASKTRTTSIPEEARASSGPSEHSVSSEPAPHSAASAASEHSAPPEPSKPAAPGPVAAASEGPEGSEVPVRMTLAPPNTSLPSPDGSPAHSNIPSTTQEAASGHAPNRSFPSTHSTPNHEGTCQPHALDTTPAPLTMSVCAADTVKTAAHSTSQTEASVESFGQSVSRDVSTQSGPRRKKVRRQPGKVREKSPDFNELLHVFSPSPKDPCDIEAHGFASIQDMANDTEVLARGGVTLNTRVRRSSELHEACDRLAACASMPSICPAETWRFGPPAGARTGAEDSRYFVIMGWNEAVTHTHCDSGVQTVLYITRGGVNRIIGVPRPVASAWQAVRDTVQRRWEDPKTAIEGVTPSILRQIELYLLRLCLQRGLLEWGQFVGPAPSDDRNVAESSAGCAPESMASQTTSNLAKTAAVEEGTELEALVILPQAGHIVQTGSHKVRTPILMACLTNLITCTSASKRNPIKSTLML